MTNFKKNCDPLNHESYFFLSEMDTLSCQILHSDDLFTFYECARCNDTRTLNFFFAFEIEYQ